MKNKKRLLFLLYFVMSELSYINAQTYSTRPYQSDIRSLQLLPNNTWGALPILELGSSDYIVVNFDQINTSSAERYRYKLIHCNMDWTPSSLLDIEYLDGFNDNLVEDYAFSQTTTVNYVNYQIQFPNENVSVKLSGNYVLEVYREGDPSDIVLTACFYVLEKKVNVSSYVSSNTDKGFNKEFQQISFNIDPIHLQIRDPYADIKPIVIQNRRSDNQKNDLKPTFLNGEQLIYEHNPKLIFEAGNEYRRFQFVSIKSGGMNVDHFQYQNANYFAWLNQDRLRSRKSYLYDQDQDGRFLIRNYDGRDANIDADYAFVNFSLKVDQPFIEPVYLFGDFTYGNLGKDFEMKYNDAEKAYEYSLLLKLGSYNYMYLTKKESTGSTALVEGDYYQTENEYLTLVYYRPMGQQYDSLIGYSLVKLQ